MGDIVKKNQAWAVEIEVAEGTYLAPTAATKFVQTMTEGSQLQRGKELLERNIFTKSIGQTAPRTGMFSATGEMAVEARAASAEGAAPEFDALMQSALGARRQLLAEVISGAGHTASLLNVAAADTKFQKHDIIMIKEAGKFHVSPVKAVTADDVELVIPAADPFSDNVVISKVTNYVVADAGHPSLSISRYMEDAKLEKAVGCKVKTLALENFSTGQMPSLKFGFEGLNFDELLSAPPFSPSYSDQVPPIILSAKAFMDNAIVDINEFTLSLENTLGFKTSINAPNGRISSRATERKVSGSIDPYQDSTNVANFTKFKMNVPFSIFVYAILPGAAGEFGGVVAIWLPNCLITELGESDQDGIMKDAITFSANRGNAGNVPEVTIAFI